MGTLADKAGEVVSAGIEAAEKRSLSPTEQVMKMVTAQAGVAVILIEAIENLTSAVHVVAKQVAKLDEHANSISADVASLAEPRGRS